MAKVEIRGRLDVAQFWPKGNSDGDTVVLEVDTVLVDGEESPIFDGAFVFDHSKRKQVLGGGKLRVRLEGIDAPELHYPTTEIGTLVGKNDSFRQARAQMACVQLADRLGGPVSLSARATTEVETPSDVFDVYGRFVGEVTANTAEPGTLLLNTFLLEAGLALPSIYTSMGRREAQQYLAVAAAAGAARRGAWRWYTSEVFLDETMRNQKVADGDDVGPFVLPKLFRRLEVHRGQVRGFKSWLRERHDLVRPMVGWLEQGAAGGEPEDFAAYVSDDSSKPRFLAEPHELVFIEKAGVAYAANGEPLHDWPS